MKSAANRILFVIGSFGVGGAETQLSILSADLVRRGWEVHLFSLENHGPLREILDRAGVRIHVGGYDSLSPRPQKVVSLLRAQWRLFRLSRKLRPRVLHAFLPLTNFMGVLAGRMAGIGTIVTSRRALGTHQDRHRWWAWFDRVANRYSTLITANSQAVIVDTVRRDHVNPTKMRLIYNGLNLPAVPNVAEDRNVIRKSLGLEQDDVGLVFVANLIEYKGHRELIDAFSRIHSTYPFVHLFLIGEDRGIGRSLKEFAESLGVAPWVNFLGRRSDVTKLLSAMDLGVMASHEEGFSNALLEKLAAGLPVLATDVGGNPEALAGVPDCMTVSAKNPNDMANGLTTMISKLEQSRMHGAQRSIMTRTQYSIKSMVDRHVMLYDEVQKDD